MQRSYGAFKESLHIPMLAEAPYRDLTHRKIGVCALAGKLATSASDNACASDHLDTPTVIADPAADIGHIFVWTSSDGRRLNLVMDIVDQAF
jgi:hypothetical protein